MSAPGPIRVIWLGPAPDATRLERALAGAPPGFQVEPVASWENLVATLARDATPGVVVADLTVVGLARGEWIGRLKRQAPAWPAVVLTASERARDVVEALELGAAAVVLDQPAGIGRLAPALERAARDARSNLLAAAPGDAGVVLRDTRDILSRLFHLNPIPTALLRLGRREFVDVNDAFSQLTGFTRAEAIGRSTTELGLWQDLEVRERLLQRILKERVLAGVELTMRNRAGRACSVIAFAEIVTVQGEDYLLTSVVDVSSQKAVEAQVGKLAAFPELNPNPVLEFSAEGALTYFNRAADDLARKFGHPHIAGLLPPNADNVVRACLRTGHPRTRLETRHGTRTLSWSFYPIASLTVVHCYVGDITEKLQLEEQVRQVQKMEAIGQLAGGVAHDFNNLLTVVQMQVSLLRTLGGLDDESRAGIEEIAQAAERGANLTRQLLTFSRRQAKLARNLDLADLIGGMTKLLRRILGEDILLESNFEPGLPQVHADQGMMEQVVMNLAVNARDAMRQGGNLRINLACVELSDGARELRPPARPGRFVRLTVADTGVGISAEHLPRIFEPFFTTKEVGKGTGLGLAIVYAIVQQHEGWIEVETAEQRGTTFHVFLPAVFAREEKPAATAAPVVPGGHETILLVEDEPAVRAVARTVLRQRGYNVIEAESGVHALEVWAQHRELIDLLFTDVVMPGGVSGYDLALRCRSERPDLHVLLTSGYNRTPAADAIETAQGFGFLAKPFSSATLATAVRECLDAT